MKTEQILAEIGEINLAYLMLAQNLIRTDKVQALFRLGISLESAELIEALSSAQLLKLAGSGTLLCRFRAGDEMVWSLLAGQHHGQRAHSEAADQLHAQLVMASRFDEVLDGSHDPV